MKQKLKSITLILIFGILFGCGENVETVTSIPTVMVEKPQSATIDNTLKTGNAEKIHKKTSKIVEEIRDKRIQIAEEARNQSINSANNIRDFAQESLRNRARIEDPKGWKVFLDMMERNEYVMDQDFQKKHPALVSYLKANSIVWHNYEKLENAAWDEYQKAQNAAWGAYQTSVGNDEMEKFLQNLQLKKDTCPAKYDAEMVAWVVKQKAEMVAWETKQKEELEIWKASEQQISVLKTKAKTDDSRAWDEWIEAQDRKDKTRLEVLASNNGIKSYLKAEDEARKIYHSALTQISSIYQKKLEVLKVEYNEAMKAADKKPC
jgi:hypothetical protein